MSATPVSSKMVAAQDQRAGMLALGLLRLTLMGCAAAMVAVVGNVIWKILAH